MIAVFFVLPLLAGLACFFGESRAVRRMLLLLTALVHSALTAQAWVSLSDFQTYTWLRLDSLGLIVLTITDLLFLVSAIYAQGYLSRELKSVHYDENEQFFFKNISEQIFCGCLLLFLAAMSLLSVSQHFGLIWIALETTTLTSAPLVSFHKHHRSLEAMWKYLLICSVGIALGLLGTFFLAASAVSSGEPQVLLVVDRLVALAPQLNPFWLKLSFLFIFVGFGTKMGLAPFHSWLPDAHSEAPSLVSVLLSGSLLNCAFLGMLRVYQVVLAAGHGQFAQELFLAFGVLSLLFATIFIIRQRDFKRMLAYSSVEHMGILSLAVGVGGRAALFGCLLHAVNHALTKGMLFMTAGNIQYIYQTRLVSGVRGLCTTLPCSCTLWVLGFLAIAGVPPFGLFISKFIILQAAFIQGHAGVAVITLTLLTLVFFALTALVMKMVYGTPETKYCTEQSERWTFLLPPLLLLAGTLLLGVQLPAPLKAVLEDAVTILGVK